jgi:hypothetical protein
MPGWFRLVSCVAKLYRWSIDLRIAENAGEHSTALPNFRFRF